MILKYYHFEGNSIELKKCEAKYELEDLVKIVYVISENQKYMTEARLRAKDILRNCSFEMVDSAK